MFRKNGEYNEGEETKKKEVPVMKKHTVDMTQGNIFTTLIKFTIPIIIAGVLQALYTAIDMAVVGNFSSETSLAAVTSTTPAINLMINVFIGMSSATNVIVARKFGAGNKSGVEKAMHTAIAVCLVGGLIITVMGMLMAKNILTWMKCSPEVLGSATLYMKLYFLAVPATLVYNFSSAIMRAFGDSKRPTYFLAISGLLKVLLNLLFVIVFKLDVVGVAIATIVSQLLAATLVVRALRKFDEGVKLSIRKIKFHANELREILLLGIPAGIQSSIFSLSNVIIQSSINSCGPATMSANGAASSIENIHYVAINAFFHAMIAFIGQNVGAKRFDRIKKSFWIGLAASGIFGFALSMVLIVFAEPLMGIYVDSKEVIKIGAERMIIVGGTQFLCGFMEIGTGSLRGLGVASRSMFTCLIGSCGVRLLMNWMFYPYNEPKDLVPLYCSYPISWIITSVALVIFFFSIVNSREKKWKEKLAAEKENI